MSVVHSAALVAADAVDGLSLDHPVIGWHNVVSASGIVADSAEANYPASNLANPATHLEWRAGAAGEQYLTITTDETDPIDYVAVAGHNWGSGEIPVSIEAPAVVDAFTMLLLHFEGADGSTSFVDSSPSPKTFTASGNAQIDTAQRVVEAASGLFDGTGDYVSTPDHADLALGSSNFTVDCWFRVAAAGAAQLLLCGQMDSAASVSSTSFFIERRSSNDRIRFLCGQGAGTTFTVESLAAYTNAVNTGWHHLAVVRNGSSLMMFIDGVIQQTTAISGAINNSTNAFALGRGGELVASTWNGSIDEFRLSVGVARWTANFTPTDTPYNWAELVDDAVLPDDGVALFRFVGQVLPQIRIRLQESAGSADSAKTTTTIRERVTSVTPGGAFTLVDLTTALIPGAIVASIGIYSSVAATLRTKIVKRNSAGNFDIVVDEAFAHPGGGFVDHTLASPYTIPSSGSYYLAALNDASVNFDATAIGSRAFKAGDVTGAGQSGFTEDSAAGTTMPMRYTYDALPRAAVVYVGKSLVLERKLYVGHVALTDGRKAQIVSGRSESGKFLGRINLGATRETTVPLSLISPDWFRDNMRPFLAAAEEDPFFFAWRPQTYPIEAGFAWLTDDPAPAPVGPSNRLAFELKLGGIV